VIDIPKEMEEAKESSDTGGDFEAAKPMAKPADQKVEVKEVEATEESKPAAGSEMKKDQSATRRKGRTSGHHNRRSSGSYQS